MKKIIYLIVCISTTLSLFSCNLPEEDTTKGLSPELKNKITAYDTSLKELKCKVDSLAHGLTQAKKENAKLEEKSEGRQNTWIYILLVVAALIIVSLILCFLCFFRKSKSPKEEERVDESVKQRLDDFSHRIEKLGKDVKSLQGQRSNNALNAPVQDYESRLRQLEQQWEQIMANVNKKDNTAEQPAPSCNGNPDAKMEAGYQRVGYAKNDADVYFTKICESNQEGCVFKITFTSPTKGKFNIISLDKIQSRNDWQQKVECSGISIKEASDFRVEHDGICEQIDDSIWKVTKPLKIKLLK